ncbi:lipid A export permease/ATP-binding protein MsbA [Nisaea acidiphila]|uniref:Lipid A export permease/ATP-binding protein MsbA n=1 Tax=Nisaea acidiphila TaxID=1862145 RepID=A0A9J7AVV1_9PROT|nr:lipid A export permease/ATP-binding protein MsbA [Nisaea acidiphila]UUX51471.1 lipid A export permease/ATP-binding protein MsbA [Nisaea acidiphila]
MSRKTDRTKISLTDENSISLMKRVVGELVRPYTLRLVLAGFCMVLVAAATALSAWLMDPMVNKIFIEKDLSVLWLVAGAVVATFFVKSVATYAQEVMIGYVGQRVVADTQARLYRHLINLDLGLFQDRHSGTLISHFTFDINTMRNAVANALVGLGRDSLSVIFLVAVMFYQEWLLACITFVVAPLSAYPIRQLGKRMRRVSAQTQEEMGSMTTLLTQGFQGIRMIKSYGLEEHETGRVQQLVERIFGLNYKGIRVKAAPQPIIDFLGGVAVAAVILYGGARVIEGQTSAGAFFSFIAATLMAYQPLRALGKINTNLQEGLAAAQRVFALLDRQPTIRTAPEAKALPRAAGAVEFSNVRFSYASGDESEQGAALNDVSFEAPSGRVTALVGPSGAGKSTVFSMIPRFYDPGSGEVRVNGVDIRTVTLESLRDTLAIVSQDVVLFDDTVINNIRFGRLGASDEEVRAAARAAAADEFISALPNGYETVIGEQGTKLSGGQRQRLAIARAILKDAPILLLDEATSALDTESERQIQNALKDLMTGRTTLVIAHRLSTIQHADVIHVFDAGKVVESGTHEALLEKEGLYAHLHGLQFGPADTVVRAGQ